MAELMQPDIVGNYLSSYNAARQRQQAEQDRQRTMMRQDRQDDMAEQSFAGQQDAQKLDMAIKRGQVVASIIGGVRDDDLQGFEAAKNRVVQEFGIDPAQMAHLTIKDLPRLRTESGLALKQLQEQAMRANIRQSDAAAAASNRANRGGGAPPPASAGASVVGGYSTVPIPDPYSNMSTPAQRDALYRQEARSHAKTMEDARDAANVAAGARSQYGQFKSLAERNQTGGWYGAPVIGPIARGIAGAVDSDLATMNALTARLAPNMRPPGSGASSNYDAQQFERATVGIDKPNEANVNISNAAIAQADRDIAYAQFADWYFRKARTQQGMDQAWLEYVNANPIFDPNDPNGYGLNEKRMDWQQWFGAAQGGQGTAPTAAAPPPAKSGGWSVKKVR